LAFEGALRVGASWASMTLDAGRDMPVGSWGFFCPESFIVFVGAVRIGGLIVPAPGAILPPGRKKPPLSQVSHR